MTRQAEFRSSRLRRGAVALSLLALLAGAVQASAFASTNKPSLGSMLLTVDQMPTGWSVDSSSGSGIGCLARILEPAGIKQTAAAEVTFEDNGSLPQVVEKLATYATTPSKVFANVVGTLDHCKTVAGSSDGHKVTGTVGQMSFPHYGDQSAAFLVSLTIEGLTVDEDVLVVRKGTILVGITEGGLGSPDLSQFQGFIRQALAKLG